ncbi:hypothetical protein DICVIV_08175 [Dictyocaulus viviparus]|uniref:Uncharacterized protein n=1 Tax=Dictyocaulus viviparus TaxID=29172 RepID=A0A0D8XPS0_DICVI|nr:hypothetical protein DICVIV_08175 [Dictyocaulus viviparus]
MPLNVMSHKDYNSLWKVLLPSFCDRVVDAIAYILGLNGTGLSWPCVFVVSGFALRIVSSPFHILAEKLFAQRLHAENYLTAAILNKLGQYHKVEVGPNESRSKLELKTSDPKIVAHSERLMNEIISQYMLDNRLQISRIQNLKICTVPFWVFSSFAVRNIISLLMLNTDFFCFMATFESIVADFHPSIPGGLWVTNMLAPDPYFILPFFVGIFGFLNLYHAFTHIHLCMYIYLCVFLVIFHM